MSFKLRHNETENKYEYHVDGHIAYITYDNDDGKIHLTHTIVPSDLGGKGIAKKLLIDVLEEIKKNNQKAVAECSYVVAFEEKNSDYADYFTK